jgi:DNA-binding LacI/PurR family transcriptional regulator
MGTRVDGKTEPVTLQTIADKLGVSRTTVSNAFSKPDQLTPRLRTKILRTAQACGYCGPDPAARTLRKGKTGAYGLLLNESLSYTVTDSAAVLLLQGIAEVFDEHGVGLLVLPNSDDRTLGVQPVLDAVVDGFVIYSLADDDPRVTPVVARKTRLVVIEEPMMDGVAFVGLDDRSGARQIAEHVIALGHRRLAAVTFPLAEDQATGFVDAARMAQATIRVTRERLSGFAQAAADNGIQRDELPVFETLINSIEEGKRAAAAILDRAERPTTILATSDVLAIGAMQAARERGLMIPRDLSVTGFDDIPEAGRAEPPLTTVRQPLREKGALAARLLLDGWEGEPPTRILPTELIVRASTGPVPIDGGAELTTRLRNNGVPR